MLTGRFWIREVHLGPLHVSVVLNDGPRLMSEFLHTHHKNRGVLFDRNPGLGTMVTLWWHDYHLNIDWQR